MTIKADFDRITDLESMKEQIDGLATEIGAWLNTSDTTTWTGTTSALSAAGVGFFPFGYWGWDKVDIDNLVDEKASHLWKTVLDAYGDQKWIDKADDYGVWANEFDMDNTGIFYGDAWAEQQVEDYEDEDGMSNEEANQAVSESLSQMARPAMDYAMNLLTALRDLKKYLDKMPEKPLKSFAFKSRKVGETQTLEQLGTGGYDFVQVDFDIESILDDYGEYIEDRSGMTDATGAVTKQAQGDYLEIWLTDNNAPFADNAVYELVYTDSDYRDWMTEGQGAVEREKAVVDALPHGSGIDGDWTVDADQKGNLECSNSYHVMSGETGMYIGWVDFSFKLTFDSDTQKYTLSDIEYDQDMIDDLVEASTIPAEESEDGEKYSDFDPDGLQSYLDDTIYESLNSEGFVE